MPPRRPHPRISSSRWAVPATLAALAFCGCGGARTVRVQGDTVTVGLEEFRILPRSMSVPAGRIRILVANHGVLTHNLALELAHRDSNGNPVILTDTQTIFPGASATLLTPALRPGNYVLVSSVANQADLGMSANLIVR
jgi:hypothetical protein